MGIPPDYDVRRNFENSLSDQSGMTDRKQRQLKLEGVSVSLELDATDIRKRLESPEHFKGPDSFDTVINFGQTFVNLGMRNEGIPIDEQWSSKNLPPAGIKILEFSKDPLVRLALKSLKDIASGDFYDDTEKCELFYTVNAVLLRSAAVAAGIPDMGLRNQKFLSFVRAGAAAGKMLNIDTENQILIQTKRLHMKGDKLGDISVGITYFDPDQIVELNGKDWIIADPAGATYGSIVANVIYLNSKGVRPNKITILNTVASHKGALFALDTIRGMDIDVQIVAGGYSAKMNENYYLENSDGTPSIRDAGDGLNGFLPPELQL